MTENNMLIILAIISPVLLILIFVCLPVYIESIICKKKRIKYLRDKIISCERKDISDDIINEFLKIVL